jgi:hypothetical protein
MCMMVSRRCVCGQKLAHLNFRDNLLSPEILVNLYCPHCGPQANFDPETMVADCGWIMEYDLEGARVLAAKGNLAQRLTPEYIFDEGYLTWQGFAPGDHDIRAELHTRLAPLIKEDMSRYLQALKTEWLTHVEGLKAAGWRRAQQA